MKALDGSKLKENFSKFILDPIVLLLWLAIEIFTFERMFLKKTE